MSIPKHVPRQRDFSAGEVREDAMRRDDSPLVRAGARQASNKRVLATGALDQRPGRSVLFAEDGRTDEISIAPGLVHYFCFGAGTLHIRDVSGILVASIGGLPWTLETLDLISWDVFESDVYICYSGMAPKVVHWSGASWSSADYEPRITSGGQKRTIFYRLAPGGVTMTPGGSSGAISITFSADWLRAGHVGSRMRYQNRQITVTGVTDAQHGTAVVNETLLGGQTLPFGTTINTAFTVGDVVEGESSHAKGRIVSFPDAQHMTVVLLTAESFKGANATASVGELVLGPTASAYIIGFPTSTAPPASEVWDEEVMNALWGWPQSVFVDQGRVGFCDFQGVPRGIAWSSINIATDLYPGASPADAIFELVPGKARVFNVFPGDDEFVFTSMGVLYIPISESTPLKPGSISFRQIDREACSSVRPVATPEAVVYVNADRTRILAIRPTGQTAKPYLVRDISEFHSHLIKSPEALASSGTGFAEHYLYVLNSDRSMAVGRHDSSRDWVGWVPWHAIFPHAFEWVSAASNRLPLVNTRYAWLTADRTDVRADSTAYTADVGGIRLVEQIDPSAYLDAQVPLNPGAILSESSFASASPPPSGRGALWFMVGGSNVALMDGLKPLGNRDVDTVGNVIPEPGEDLSAGTIVAGLVWTETFEPFMPHVQEGESRKQSLRRRKVGRIAVTTKGTTGYVCAGRRVPPWRQGENQELAPPMREETQFFKRLGRSIDPHIQMVKDVPGPLRLIEFGEEITV